jgi:hypothetical protein
MINRPQLTTANTVTNLFSQIIRKMCRSKLFALGWLLNRWHMEAFPFLRPDVERANPLATKSLFDENSPMAYNERLSKTLDEQCGTMYLPVTLSML